jgi:hypothetical protein
VRILGVTVVWIEIDTLVIKKMVLDGRAGRGDRVRGGRGVRYGGYRIMGPYCVLRCSLIVVGRVLLSGTAEELDG